MRKENITTAERLFEERKDLVYNISVLARGFFKIKVETEFGPSMFSSGDNIGREMRNTGLGLLQERLEQVESEILNL